MAEEPDEAFERVVRATDQLKKAWEQRAEARDGLLRAIQEQNEASSALAVEWNRARSRPFDVSPIESPSPQLDPSPTQLGAQGPAAAVDSKPAAACPGSSGAKSFV